MASNDTRAVNYGACECCGSDCCLYDMTGGDGMCVVMAPAVNDFDPTAGAELRIGPLYLVDLGGGYFALGNVFRVVLAGVTTLDGKQTCYYLEFRVSVVCDSTSLRINLWAPNVIFTNANDTCRWILGFAYECESPAAGDTDTVTFDCTAGTYATGKTLTVSFDWRDERSNTDYTTSMTWTVYVGAASAGPVCPAYTGSVDPDDFNVYGTDDCGGLSPFIGEWVATFADGSVTALEALFGIGNCECADTDDGDPWESPDNPPPGFSRVDCNGALMRPQIPASFGTNTGDCDCADGAGFQFIWFATDTDGHGYYASTLIRRCGHSIHFIITCALDGGVPTWFLEGFVDGVSTGTLAWDFYPGNDPDNPDHFEFHWDLFGDLCTGRIFVVAG